MTDPLKALRAYRAPLWARILGRWRARQELKATLKRERLVGIVKQWTWWTDNLHWDHQAYFCYRRGDGIRRYEHISTSSLLDSKEKRSRAYIMAVKPWVDGAMTDDTLVQWSKATINQPEKIPS